MRYDFFEVENFKGIQKIRLDLASVPRGQVFPLVGLNESGKTTILEAINFFSYGEEELDSLELSGYSIGDVHDLIPVSKRANFNGAVTIRVGLGLDEQDVCHIRDMMRAHHAYQLSSMENKLVVTETIPFKNSKAQQRQARWSVKAMGRLSKQRKDRAINTVPEIWSAFVQCVRSLMPTIWYFPNFLFEFPDRIYLDDPPSSTEARADRNAFYRQVVQDILDSLDNETTWEQHLLARAKSEDSNDQHSLEGLLLEMGRNVTNRVFTEWMRIFNRRVQGKEVMIDAREDDAGLCYLRFRIKDADGYFSISERSLGFRWFFVYLLLTLYRGWRKGASRDILFLFDEPASNLHSSAQAQLLLSIERLGERCAVVYTTHSHHLIDPKWLETTYIVRNTGLEYGDDDDNYSARKTCIEVERYRTFAASHPQQSRYFQPILDVLDYRPSELENVPRIVMLEGKNDYYILRYMQEVILKSAEPLYLMPGGGAGSLIGPIRLYIAWGRQFVVLLDADAEGARQKEKYEREFGVLIEGRVIVLGDVDLSWKSNGMERMCDEDELIAIQQTAYPELNKFGKTQFGRAIQEALMLKKEVGIGDETRHRFRRLLDYLRDKIVTEVNE